MVKEEEYLTLCLILKKYIWNITKDGTNIDPESRFGKKIIDFVKLEISTRVFVDDDAMDKWFNEQSV